MILYGETKDMIKDLLVDAMKNANNKKERDVAFRCFLNWEELLSNLEPSGLCGSKIN